MPFVLRAFFGVIMQELRRHGVRKPNDILSAHAETPGAGHGPRTGTAKAAAGAAIMLALAGLAGPLEAAELTARDVVSTLFKAAPGSKPNFAGNTLDRLDLAGLDFKEADLAKANLFGADLSGSNLSKANLAGANLDRATVTRTNFDAANMTGATILRPNIYATLEASRTEVPSFVGAKMSGAHLGGRFDLTSFHGAELTGARFGPKDHRNEVLITGRAELVSCDFSDAVLRDANLSRTWAQYAKFNRADLKGANLAYANLKGADFTGAELAGADFTGSVLDGANFTDAKGLDRVRGLQEGLHRGDGTAPVSR